MIVDIHTHFFSPREISETLRADMERCGIDPGVWDFTEEDYLRGTEGADFAAVFGIRAKATGWSGDNEKISAFAAKHKKLIFFASIDPAEKNFTEQLKYCHSKLKCKGVKLGPVYQNVHPHDKRYCEIYKYCEANGLPVITHMAATFASGAYLEHARPILMDKVACDFPGLKIILAHMGHPWEGEAIAAIRKQPNLYADLSALYYRPWQFYNAMRLAEEYGAYNKIFFGSDFPATTTRGSVEGINNKNEIVEGTGLPAVSKTMLDEIIYRDTLGILEIEPSK